MAKSISNCTDDFEKWFPESVCCVESIKDKNYALVILNRKIKLSPEITKELWQNAKIRLTIDGGTNRWLNFLNSYCQNDILKAPDIISGDFDSITKETLNYFQEKGSQIIHTPDQNETDFTKGLKLLKPLIRKENLETIIVIHETSGRIDQTLGNINTLFKINKIYERDLKIYLMSHISITWLLNPGKHSIAIPLHLYENRRWCALIPIGQEAVVSTTGLKWNLNNAILKFGGIVSSSNTYSSQLVTICTNNSLLWSMGVFNFNDNDDD